MHVQNVVSGTFPSATLSRASVLTVRWWTCHSRLALLAVVSLALLFLNACQSETRFRSNFDDTPVGNFPAAIQGVGSGAVDGPAGSVVIVTLPDLPGHWARISRATSSSPVSGFQGTFDKVGGEGKYTFTTTLQIPAGTGITTVSCESFGQPTTSLSNFFHVDFLPTGVVRVNDSANVGTHTRGKPLILQIRLNIGASSGTGHVSLSGDGATGEGTFDVQTAFLNQARQFGAVRVWLGANSVGSANATNIVVKRD